MFAILDEIESDAEDDIDNLLDDSDTEFIVDTVLEEPIGECPQPLVPEANIHVICQQEQPPSQPSSLSSSTEPPSKRKRRNEEVVLEWNKKGKMNKIQSSPLDANILLRFTPYLVFDKPVKIDELVDAICEQINLYVTQHGCEFRTNRAFLGINYIMSICKLPSLKCYWQSDHYITNDGIQNVITLDRFYEILQNLHFCDNFMADKTDKGK